MITGLNGTLAPHVANEAKRRGYNVSGWDRHAVPPEDEGASHAWLIDLNPQAIVHLAMGSESWAGQLARFALMKSIPFVFTSTAMVFDHVPDGPHAVDSVRTAQDEYGRYKIRCEDSIRSANPHAMVVRIGWQIDPDTKGNNMLCALDAWQAREGCVSASRAWTPACSFMTDTAFSGMVLGEPNGNRVCMKNTHTINVSRGVKNWCRVFRDACQVCDPRCKARIAWTYQLGGCVVNANSVEAPFGYDS